MRNVVLARLLRLGAILLVLWTLFVLSLTAAYSLPQGPVVANLRASLPDVEAEGLVPQPIVKSSQYQLDNLTDILMLDTSIAMDSENPLQRAMAMRNALNTTPTVNATDALARSLGGGARVAEPYAYYWHGYQLFLRPALMGLSYSEVRWMNLLCLGALGLAVGLFMVDKAGRTVTVAYFMSLLFMGFYVVPASLQFSSVVYTMLVCSLAVVATVDRATFARLDVELFLVAGASTAFLDLLTAPLLTLGMPLAVAIAMLGNRDPNRTLWQDALLVLRASFSWAAGYALTWIAKAAIATFVLRASILARAYDSLLIRSGLESRGELVFAAVRRNVLGLLPIARVTADASGAGRVSVSPSVTLVATVLAVAVLWALLANRKSTAQILSNAHVLLVAPMPYLWFVVLSNHSAVHYWFSYRIQAVAIFPLLYFVASSIDVPRIKRSFTSSKPSTG